MTKAKARAQSPSAGTLDIVGADANNLKHVDVRIPLDGMTVVTGVSGSGKSSLVGDTLAVEAERRMRAFLDIRQPQLEGSPPRAFIGRMPAVIHFGQRAFRASVRTTVGTATGLLTTLRRFFVASSRPYSDELAREIPDPSPATYAAWIVKHYRGTATVWAAPVRHVATDGLRAAEQLRKHGAHEVVVRSETDTPKVWEHGRTVSLAKFKPLRPDVKHVIEARIGAVEITPRTQQARVEALLTQAFAAGQGQVVVELPGTAQRELLGPFGPRLDTAVHRIDPDSALVFFEPNAHLLSFNAPEHPESGACPTCRGLGRATTLDECALVTVPQRSMNEGAFSLWSDKNYTYVNIQHATIEGLRGMRGFSPDIPWKRLPEAARRLVLEGSGAEMVTDKEPKTGRKLSAPRPFEGFRRAILDRVARGTKVSESLKHLVSQGECPDCLGTRWSRQARALRIAGLGIHHLLAIPFQDLLTRTAEASLFAVDVPEAAVLVRMLHHQAAAFVSVGLGHLTGDRGMLDVSEGESRRARLATILHAHQEGLCILLDEPARGLHDEDVQLMAEAVADLGRKNTLVVSEHRHALNRAADHVIELGPGAGGAGGEVVYEGPVTRSSWAKEPVLNRPRLAGTTKPPFIEIRGATIHNLDDVDCDIPLGRLTCLTGVSGSGKSSFVRGVLVPAVAGALSRGVEIADFERRSGSWTRIDGAGRIKGLIALDQGTPGPNRRSIVATFLGLSDDLRAVFGTSEQARRVGLSPVDFGLNAGEGRCKVCLGIGEVQEHDRWTVCPGCGGARFAQDALSVRVEEWNIRDFLDLAIADLAASLPAFLSPHQKLLTAIVELGIGHVALGRRMDTLSGGEVQRLRIAAKLAERDSNDLLFVLDEPAAGLHPRDVERLVRALDRIVDGGRNTVVLVEHNPAILQAADWVIEFGPGSGPHGGRIVASGPPEKIAQTDTATGRVLSGRPAPSRPRFRSAPTSPCPQEIRDAVGRAERTRAWIRHLLGEDLALPDDTQGDESPGSPIVILSERTWRGRRAHEIGDLDLELAKLLLDLHVHETTPHDVQQLAADWARDSDICLLIHPFLRELQIWGPRVPASTLQMAAGHVASMGLRLSTVKGEALSLPVSIDLREIRATGERFTPRTSSVDERVRILHDALALGGNHFELRNSRGGLFTRRGSRLLDLHSGIVAPIAAVPAHFSRRERHGCCPMCKGTGHVTTLAETLVIADPRAAPEADDFLHPAAASVMKGVRRNELLPFLRRLSEEGLWERDRPFQRLDQQARNLILFGFWSRPGHGTFLKNAKEDPAEVGSWLRWDGLYHALSEQLERSSDARWKTSIAASREDASCPACEATGLAPHARVLPFAGHSLHEWIRDGVGDGLHEALSRLKVTTPRQHRTQQRLLACLAPLVHGTRACSLHEAVEIELAQNIGRLVVETFTTMPAVHT